MKRRVCVLLFLLPFTALSPGASAQPAGSAGSPADAQKLGQQLFVQHCGACHRKPTIVNESFGPTLSRDSLGGQDAALREPISNGTPRMPGFKYQFASAQIDAVIAYVKSLPPQPAPAPAAPR
jgi:mono/diheme cytochrome c family protein